MSKTITTQSFAFKKGYNQVKRGDLPAIQKSLMSILGVTNRNSFYAYMNGKLEPKASIAVAIESLFAEYGIVEVWGIE